MIFDDLDPQPLYWESSVAIIQALRAQYPNLALDGVGLAQLAEWIIALPGFSDDPALANEGILQDILREWYEELNPL